MNLFSGSTFQALERGLDGSQMRQHAMSQNIANAGTPNYSAKKVSFKHTLNSAMNNQLQAHKTNEKHVNFSQSSNEPIVDINRNTTYNHNGNNVDIDLEMAELAKNQIYYNALIERLNSRFQGLQSTIRGGN
ncbi:flagellar basal body rod protein FlgB [Bacillus sp. FJAT-45037]|uniref:flagellar basal body rod protein FlgB n=1 Tax=Bacillus sp. FJAT-45037 TaxID=2011007 RepID=UPI000C24D747|nr:flagellar basal body rod protein FlgB [Bacillus sp. FJAT-45037]